MWKLMNWLATVWTTVIYEPVKTHRKGFLLLPEVPHEESTSGRRDFSPEL